MNAIFRVRMIQGSPQFPRPAGLAESEEWAVGCNPGIGYWSEESVEGKEWAKYCLNNLMTAQYEAAKADTENYQFVKDGAPMP